MAKISSVIAIIVIVCSSLVLAVYMRFELPNTTSDLNIPGLDGQVTVTQDQYGLYHIVASSERAGLMAEGYLMAHDRLWQMDFYRRQAEGNLSQILYNFDNSTLKIDYSLRALGLYRIADQHWNSFSNETKSFYQSFSDGVNLFIKNNENRLPIEFGILNYRPSEWSPVDTIAILKLMAFGLNARGGGEALVGKGLSFINDSTLLDLVKLTLDNNNITWSDPVAYPIVKKASPTTNTTSTSTNTTSTNTTNTTISTSTNPTTQTSFGDNTHSSFFDLLASEFSLDSNMGSNNWVVSGQRTATGKPMLANDPHMPLETPARWWFVDLKTPNFHITGMTFPGIAGIVLGRNDHFMWGMTNSEIDYLDTYVEMFNHDRTQYYYNGSWLNTTILPEKFCLSQSYCEVKDIYITSGNGSFAHGLRPMVPLYGENVSIRWTAQDSTSAAESLVKMVKSQNFHDFINALELFNAPGQNVVWADETGAIGLYVTGDIPIRNAGYGLAPHNGSISTYEWKGYVPSNESYQITKTTGFIATANNHVIPSSYPYFLGYAFDSNYRINRITDLLNANSNVSYDYMAQMQNDVHSLFAQSIIPLIIIPTNDPFIQSIESSLLNWNDNYYTNSTQGPILALFTKYFLNYTLNDEITSNFLDEIPIKGKLIENLLKLPADSHWFNDTNTQGTETKTDIILKAYNAVKGYYLSHDLNISTYTWGQMHKVQFSHILGSEFNFFNAGGLQPSPGDDYTISVGTYNQNFIQTQGASMRQIMGMDSAKTFMIVIPGGESGLVAQDHYADQVTNWLQGRYVLVKIEE